MADKTLAYYLAHPDEITAALEASPHPIEDQLAISIAKNPLLLAMIVLQLDAAGWTPGSP